MAQQGHKPAGGYRALRGAALFALACAFLPALATADEKNSQTKLRTVPTAQTTVRTNLPFRAPRKTALAADESSAQVSSQPQTIRDPFVAATGFETDARARATPPRAAGNALPRSGSAEAAVAYQLSERSLAPPAAESTEPWDDPRGGGNAEVGPLVAEEYAEHEAGDYCAECGGFAEPFHDCEPAGGHRLHGLFSHPRHWFRSSKNSPPATGHGDPLRGTSWLNRPNSVSFFAGILNGDELITNRVDQGSALFGGFRLGWDFDHYWGLEARAGWSSPELEYAPAQFVERVDGIFLCDASFLYYPWGDAAWRPYGLLGMGMARFDFVDDIGQVHDEYLLGIPIGIGMKYMYHPNLVFRAEFLDNYAAGSSGVNTMNNLSFTLGMELRYGGKPRTYYPWQPAKYIW